MNSPREDADDVGTGIFTTRMRQLAPLGGTEEQPLFSVEVAVRRVLRGKWGTPRVIDKT
jgi:hypothetical protein